MTRICPHCYVGDLTTSGACNVCGHRPPSDIPEPEDRDDDGLWRFLLVWAVIVVGTTVLLMRACAP